MSIIQEIRDMAGIPRLEEETKRPGPYLKIGDKVWKVVAYQPHEREGGSVAALRTIGELGWGRMMRVTKKGATTGKEVFFRLFPPPEISVELSRGKYLSQTYQDLGSNYKVEEVLREDASVTAKQWYAEAPKVVKSQGMKYTLKPKATVKSGETVYFKYWAPKPKGEVMAPIIQFVVTYNRGSDLYDIEIESYDINMNKIGARRLKGLGFDNFSNFGFLRDVMQESKEVDDSRLQDDLKEFAKAPERVRDHQDRYASAADALADMQAQLYDGRRGTMTRPKAKE